MAMIFVVLAGFAAASVAIDALEAGKYFLAAVYSFLTLLCAFLTSR